MLKMNVAEWIQTRRSQVEERRIRIKRRKEIIHKSFLLGIGIFIVLSVILKLFLGIEAWKIYAIADAVTGAITNIAILSFRDKCEFKTTYEQEQKEFTKTMSAAIKVFFMLAFVLGIVMHVETWLGLSVHIGITIIAIGIFC